MFESCYELREAFQLLFQREDKLLLATGEVHPTQRLLGDEIQGTEMVGVEHLGQYVFEMTSAKVEALRNGKGVFGDLEEGKGQISEIEDEGDLEELEEEEDEDEEEEQEAKGEGGEGYEHKREDTLMDKSVG